MLIGSSQLLVQYEKLIPASAYALKEANLSQKAQELSTKANGLKNEVDRANSDPNAAKVLKAKIGTGRNDGRLWHLVWNLMYTTNKLHNAVHQQAGPGDHEAYKLAKAVLNYSKFTTDDWNNLNTANTWEEIKTSGGNSLIKALVDLAIASTDLTAPAGKVKSQYAQVAQAFQQVQTQNDSRRAYNNNQDKYLAVVKAWNAFNAVYKAEEHLNTALTNPASNLSSSLNQLNSAPEDDLLDVCSKASEALKKYNILTKAIKEKLEDVKKFESAYKSTTNDIKQNYTEIVDNHTDLKNAFNDALRINKFWIIVWPSVIAQWLNFLTYVILLFVYVPGDSGHLTMFYWVIAVSGFVFGLSNVLTFAIDDNYLPIYIAGENSFPATTSLIHYLSSLMFGNRRKWNSDFLMVYIDLVVAILISFAAAAMWTVAYLSSHKKKEDKTNNDPDTFWHINPPDGYQGEIVNPKTFMPFLMVLVGMGLVYCIYPAIAPGMIVPFYLVDKIEMVLLIATIFPPLIVAIVTKYKFGWSPKAEWKDNSGDPWAPGSPCNYLWHFFDLVIPTMIILAYLFIYSLHYRDSSVARSIINQPKMSTCLTILFYMCHEILDNFT
ncbi:Tpr family protein [Theileria parva strain Muguga]|uniref:Uncharacterized protein n=1 Tax=Theileria parva TaxID=5875 RepID=Q4MYD3_THEPA|nr:uncharacterized protein TpMuguga_03g00918 [Theileria parva strain Muguga]EAN30450.1 Tpr family protein [Theileria parva strain Muguga]|eukprot:XP_762733.1 hypothetical protein [Theileria parva strain Muguga]